MNLLDAMEGCEDVDFGGVLLDTYGKLAIDSEHAWICSKWRDSKDIMGGASNRIQRWIWRMVIISECKFESGVEELLVDVAYFENFCVDTDALWRQ